MEVTELGPGIPVFVVRIQYPAMCVPVTESQLDGLLKDIQQVSLSLIFVMRRRTRKKLHL